MDSETKYPQLTINEKGNYELHEFSTEHNKLIITEFIGGANSEELSNEIREILKREYINKIFK